MGKREEDMGMRWVFLLDGADGGLLGSDTREGERGGEREREREG
jgi:hypothetical protein